MIVWINGPFGAGKSTVAPLVAAEMPGALIVDPEVVGHMLWSQLPIDLRQEEFEQEPVWPDLTRCLIERMWATYRRPLVVPMTLARPATFEQIVGHLRRSGLDVRHVTLLADRSTIRERLRQRMAARGERPDKWGELSWEGLQIERCIDALAGPGFETHVWTDARPLDRVVKDIVSAVSKGRHGAATGR